VNSLQNDKDSVAAVFKGIIVAHLCVDESKVVSRAKLNDLGADSLDMVELVLALEDSFEVDLPQDTRIAVSNGTLGKGNPDDTVSGVAAAFQRALKAMVPAHSTGPGRGASRAGRVSKNQAPR